MFLVNMQNHHLRCSAATLREPLANIMTTQEDQENTAPRRRPPPMTRLAPLPQ